MPARSRKDALVDKALQLFYRDGFHATGIDRIIAETGVAKMTLYNNFDSKEALILEALSRREEDFGRWLTERTAGTGLDPRARLLALFEALGPWFAGKDFRGCLFIRAAGEYPALSDPIHRCAAKYKRGLRDFIAGIAREASASDADALARRLMLLVEGAIVTAQIGGDGAGAAADARLAAEILIDAALRNAAPRAPKKN